MKVSGSNKALQTLTNKIKRGGIVFTHKLQRREGVWSKQAKSMLIESLLLGYPINPVYTVIDDKQAVIDGVQRLSTCYSFVCDGFSLSKNLAPITIDGQVYEIAGKKYSKLDDAVKDELNSAQIQIYEITDYTDKEVREMFRRLNAGKALNSIQKMTPDMSDELSDVIFDIVSHPIFKKLLTPAQLKSSVDTSIALEILMLCEMSAEYDFGSFSRADREKFIQYYNDNINPEKIELIKQGLDKLNEALDDDIRIPKTSISLCCYGMYRVLKDKKSTEKYIALIKKFLAEYDSNEEYLQYTHDGTASADAVKGRLAYFRNMIKTM